jgi:hypothetical protein
MTTEEMNVLIQLNTQLTQLDLSIKKVIHRLERAEMRLNRTEPYALSINEADAQLRDFFN